MEAAIISFGAAAAVAGIISRIVNSGGHRDLSLWTAVAAIILTTLSAACAYQNHLWKKDAEVADTKENVNLLVPGTGTTPTLPANVEIPDEAVLVYLGNSLHWTTTFPHAVIEQETEVAYQTLAGIKHETEKMILIERDGLNVFVTAKFFDHNGDIICEILKNRFHQNDANVFRIESTPHRLVVIDKEGRTALDLEYVNERCIRLLGDFHYRYGYRVIIRPDWQEIKNPSRNIDLRFGGNIFPHKPGQAPITIAGPENGANPEPALDLSYFSKSMERRKVFEGLPSEYEVYVLEPVTLVNKSPRSMSLSFTLLLGEEPQGNTVHVYPIEGKWRASDTEARTDDIEKLLRQPKTGTVDVRSESSATGILTFELPPRWASKMGEINLTQMQILDKVTGIKAGCMWGVYPPAQPLGFRRQE